MVKEWISIENFKEHSNVKQQIRKIFGAFKSFIHQQNRTEIKAQNKILYYHNFLHINLFELINKHKAYIKIVNKTYK